MAAAWFCSIGLVWSVVTACSGACAQEPDASESDSDDDESDEGVDEENMKLVLVVRSDLSMRTGKIAAQCSHATLGVCDRIQRRGDKRQQDNVRRWKRYGQAKIVLKVPTEEEMLVLAGVAESLRLPTYVVVDAGRTQIAAGSRTVLAIGPAPTGSIDPVTRGLKLL